MSFVAFGQKETRDHSNFDEISLGYPAELIIRQGNEYSVELEGDRDDLEDIRTEVRGSTLVIKNDRNGGWFNFSVGRSVTIYVTMKDIRRISVSGSGKAETRGKIETGDLDLDVSGSGKIEVSADAEDVTIDISGSGSIILEGSGEDGEIDISGSGRLYAENFEADSFDVAISGSGRCEVNVSQILDARISGSGSVYYRGDPDKIRSSVSGSGRVRKM